MAKQSSHVCSESELLERLDHAVFGNDKPGLVVDMAKVHEKLDALKNILNFIKWGVAITCTVAIGWGTIIVADHFTVKDFPNEYATKEYMLQTLGEFQRQTQILENATLNTKEDIVDIRETLNQNNIFMKRYTTTRGVKQPDTFKK